MRWKWGVLPATLLAALSLVTGCHVPASRAADDLTAATSRPAPSSTPPPFQEAESEPAPADPVSPEQHAPARAPDTPVLHVEDVAAQAPPMGYVRVREGSFTLPTYPQARYQTPQVDPLYRWPYARFDVESFRSEAPSPRPRTYRTLILENEFLELTLLPELGGRILQATHKPSGTRMFYANSVVKPTAWGPLQQRGWLALGGLEWGLPVEEHGYAWGEAWGYIPLEFGDDRAAVTLFTPRDGRAINMSVTVELVAGSAAFTIEPSLTNVSDDLMSLDYWHNAMLAPGDGRSISGDVHIVLPTHKVLVHSTEDKRLPGPGQQMAWPVYGGRNMSRLSTWTTYAGIFEYPAAHGPFAAVYDTGQDAGAVRIFPAATARGSKVFALGGSQPLDPSLYTDDGSAYIELHGGLSPDFFQQSNLAAGESVSWRETWYPVFGMGDLEAANELAALHVVTTTQGLDIAVYAVRALDAEIILDGATGEMLRAPLPLQAGLPVHATWTGMGADAAQTLHIRTQQGDVIVYDVANERLAD